MFSKAHAEMPLKMYIKKWSNWVVDLHWLFTLKYFMESLPSAKLYYFIKNYPILDNFILHWMWWSYSLNKDIEIFTEDAFRAIGTMPWLMNDIKIGESAQSKVKIDDKKKMKNKNSPKKSKKTMKTTEKKSSKKGEKNKNQTKLEPKNEEQIPEQPSKFFQYNEITMKTIGSILFQNENENLKKFDQFKINPKNKLLQLKKSILNHNITKRSNSSNDVQETMENVSNKLGKMNFNYLDTF